MISYNDICMSKGSPIYWDGLIKYCPYLITKVKCDTFYDTSLIMFPSYFNKM